MKLSIAFIGTILLIFVVNSYGQKQEQIDVDSVLKNDRLLSHYIKCMLGTAKCTREGRQIKEKLPIALKTGCNNCTKTDAENVKKVIHHLRTKKPDDWKQLVAKYDSKEEYKKFFHDI